MGCNDKHASTHAHMQAHTHIPLSLRRARVMTSVIHVQSRLSMVRDGRERAFIPAQEGEERRGRILLPPPCMPGGKEHLTGTLQK